MFGGGGDPGQNQLEGALNVLRVGDTIMSRREETVSINVVFSLSKSDSELTSMPVPSASLFVLVLCGFELGDVSVATDITEVSPSRFDGAWLEDVAEAAPTSAGPEVDAVPFRGMTVAGGSTGSWGKWRERERIDAGGEKVSQRASNVSRISLR